SILNLSSIAKVSQQRYDKYSIEDTGQISRSPHKTMKLFTYICYPVLYRKSGILFAQVVKTHT
ncbi:MAG TPA: hypothetical protein PLA16_11900, partial [Chitinophagales bacterium]|nr:hypothetical protein [Chitinophagales bacterium]